MFKALINPSLALNTLLYNCAREPILCPEIQGKRAPNKRVNCQTVLFWIFRTFCSEISDLLWIFRTPEFSKPNFCSEFQNSFVWTEFSELFVLNFQDACDLNSFLNFQNSQSELLPFYFCRFSCLVVLERKVTLYRAGKEPKIHVATEPAEPKQRHSSGRNFSYFDEQLFWWQCIYAICLTVFCVLY